MKNILLNTTFLILSHSLLYSQSEAKFLIFPGCEKFESKSNKKLIDCYSNKFNQLFTLEVKKVLRDNNLFIDNVNINARIKYEINKVGEYQNLEIVGTEAEEYLLNESFYNFVMQLKKENKVIIPAKSKLGEPISLRFNIPFKILNH